MECEGSGAFTHSHEEAVSLFSLSERELRELSPNLSLCLLQKKEARGQTSFFYQTSRFFLSSSALLQLVRSEPQNNGKEGKFIVFSSSSPQTS